MVKRFVQNVRLKVVWLGNQTSHKRLTSKLLTYKLTIGARTMKDWRK
jgi:hypothetical protein